MFSLAGSKYSLYTMQQLEYEITLPRFVQHWQYVNMREAIEMANHLDMEQEMKKARGS